MRIRPDEVSAVIREQMKQFGAEAEMTGVGRVLQVGDGVARVYGLRDAMMGEMIEFPGGVYGLAHNLEEDNVGCILLGADTDIKEGDLVKTTGRIMQVPVGEAMLGRVVSALGEPVDGRGSPAVRDWRPIETRAPNVVERQPVNEPLQTGLKVIDSMTPIGRGQRELIYGDRQTGKTAIAVDTIINQKGQNCYCIYVAIGQKLSTVARVAHVLEQHGAMDYTTIVVASANDPAPQQYVAPYAGCSMGEYFREKGQHALVVYDDLTKHAQAYRQISLLLRRPPGREAFPGDIFYLHAHLLERAAKLSDVRGGGSLTALPVIETQEGDYSDYITTNVISITDGQIYLESDLFFSGFRPAMNVGISVSRVGGKAQVSAMKQVAGMLRLDLAYYQELQAFAQFATELDQATRAQLARGERMMELLKQPQYRPMPVAEQVIVLYAGTHGYVDELEVEEVSGFAARLVAFVRERHPRMLQAIRESGELSEEVEKELQEALKDCCARHRSEAAPLREEGDSE
ncbi:MAG: F0F1 ATP synthase subunit alpha [Armatimonadota bacterium]|nr:MAG: F0F1 ATP synthase subunit alpha [Armatimonadota bacterium]